MPEKSGIHFCILIIHWIPNQVGNDNFLSFYDDAFFTNNLIMINKSKHAGLLKDFSALETEYLDETRTEKPQIGYLCMRVPVEIIEAMDAVPRRISVQSGYDITECSTIRPDGCSFCRTVPSLLKLDYYKDLKAIIGGNCCDQMRRLMDTLAAELGIPVILFSAPRTWDSDKGFFINEMESAFKKLARITGMSPNDSAVRDRIIVRNKLKRKVKHLSATGKMPHSLLQKIAVSALPAERILAFMENMEEDSFESGDINLMLAGSIPGLLENDIIAQAGGKITVDLTCLGDRVFYEDTPDDGDVMQNLYASYIENNLCAHRRPLEPFIEYARQIIKGKENNPAQMIRGIIYRSLKYCHPYGLSAERIKKSLGLPFLKLDDDLSSAVSSGMRTRIEAFIEMLRMQQKAVK